MDWLYAARRLVLGGVGGVPADGPGERTDQDSGGRFHTRQGPHAVEDLRIEDAARLLAGKFGGDAEREQPLRPESGVHAGQSGEAVHEQSGAHQQERRNRHLSGDRPAAQGGMDAAAGRARTGTLQCLLRIPVRCGERGGKAEEQHRGQGKKDAEGEHRQIERCLVHARDLGRREADQQPHSDGSARQSQDSRRGGQRQRLAEQQPHQAAASCPQCRADGDLTPALGSAHQQQIGGIGAGDDEHQRHGAE